MGDDYLAVSELRSQSSLAKMLTTDYVMKRLSFNQQLPPVHSEPSKHT